MAGSDVQVVDLSSASVLRTVTGPNDGAVVLDVEDLVPGGHRNVVRGPNGPKTIRTWAGTRNVNSRSVRTQSAVEG